MQQLGPGSSSIYVRLAQRMLNRQLRRMPGFVRLREDGAYGPRTAAAVARFQQANHVTTESGVIGPRTWRALGLVIDIDHPVRMRAQHYDMGCWSAAAAMMLDRDMSVGSQGADLGRTFGLLPSVDNVTTFTRQFGWQLESPPADVRALALILNRTPIWIAGTVTLSDGSTGGHVVVISGAWGDGTPFGTQIRIHDPWPINEGAISITSYPGMVVAETLPFDPTMIAGPF